jgi:hypothetical protein
MSEIVTLDQLKAELRVSGTHEDDVIQRKLDEAEALCLDYVDQRLGDTAEDWADTVEGWRDATVTDIPPQVIAAILEMAVTLYRFRGDDVQLPAWFGAGRMPPGVRMKLDRLRDVTIA